MELSDQVFAILKNDIRIPLLAHIPHSSTQIPDALRERILLDDNELVEELLKVTDSYVDELFSSVIDAGGVATVFKLSRLIVDPERFEEDEREIMSSKGMGVIYTKTSRGRLLRESPGEAERNELLNRFYRPYHAAIENEVQNLLDTFDRCLIIDCHSFPSRPLPYELNQDSERPDICLGTDSYHTPVELVSTFEDFLHQNDLTTAVDKPFSGTYVPMSFYRADPRVLSAMVEVNRKLYIDEQEGVRSPSFNHLKEILARMIHLLGERESTFYT